MNRVQPNWLIQSVVRASSILNLFTSERPTWTEQEIVKATGLSRGTVYRFCQSLIYVGYLRERNGGSYGAGPRAMSFGHAAMGSPDVAEVARPVLLELRDRLNETVNMAILDGPDIVFVLRLQGPGLLDVRMHVGSRLPAFCTSLGRAMLARLTDAEVEHILGLRELQPLTSSTVTDPAVVLREIAEVRERGVAVIDSQVATGLRGVAVAVQYPNGRPAAGVNVALTRPFEPGEVEERLRPELDAAAARIGKMLTGDGPASID